MLKLQKNVFEIVCGSIQKITLKSALLSLTIL